MKAHIEIEEDGDALEKSITQDFRTSERSKITWKKKGKGITFFVEASDIVALRATLQSLTNMLNIFYKVKHEC